MFRLFYHVFVSYSSFNRIFFFRKTEIFGRFHQGILTFAEISERYTDISIITIRIIEWPF